VADGSGICDPPSRAVTSHVSPVSADCWIPAFKLNVGKHLETKAKRLWPRTVKIRPADFEPAPKLSNHSGYVHVELPIDPSICFLSDLRR
jgi:hypothetical protein